MPDFPIADAAFLFPPASEESLSALLNKAEASAAERKIDPEVLLGWAPRPLPFRARRQVQIATAPRQCLLRSTTLCRSASLGQPSSSSFEPSDIDVSEGRDITITFGGRPIYG